jgi:hypothetical protein
MCSEEMLLKLLGSKPTGALLRMAGLKLHPRIWTNSKFLLLCNQLDIAPFGVSIK